MQVEGALNLARRAAAGLKRLTPQPAIEWPGGVVSFSFDDFPRSALTIGGAILQAHRARGTYYVAMGLVGTTGELGPLCTLEDLRAARAQGHELGCHTFEHLNCARTPADTIADDVEQSADALAELFSGYAPTSFAYPFGAVSPAAKRLLARRFSTCRGIQPGLNRHAVDVGELRANKIYDNIFDEARMRELIDRNRAAGGWLIFYTHDVSEAPSPYGCTPAQFESVVNYAAERSTILPIGKVARFVRTSW